MAASLDQGSEHPLAAAIVNAARERKLALGKAEGFESSTGIGVRVAQERLKPVREAEADIEFGALGLRVTDVARERGAGRRIDFGDLLVDAPRIVDIRGEGKPAAQEFALHTGFVTEPRGRLRHCCRGIG